MGLRGRNDTAFACVFVLYLIFIAAAISLFPAAKVPMSWAGLCTVPEMVVYALVIYIRSNRKTSGAQK